MRRSIAFLLLLAACDGEPMEFEEPEPPHVKFIKQPLNPRNFDDIPVDLATAQELIRYEWSQRLGDRLTVPLPEIPVVLWFDFYREPMPDGRGHPPCLIYNAGPQEKCIGGTYNYGHPVYDTEIHALRWTDGFIPGVGGTVVAHEMLHWALHHATGSPNGAHDDPLWDQVGEIDLLLFEADL